MSGRRFLLCVALGLGFLALANPAATRAQPTEFEDPFATISAPFPDGTWFRFGFGALPPIPADFFGPGSDPFEEHVYATGAPLDPPVFGETSVLMLRSGHPIDPVAPPSTPGTVDIEVVALNLISTEPINVTYDGGIYVEQWDVQIQLSPIAPPPRLLNAMKTHVNGGIFDLSLMLQPLFVFTRVTDGTEMILDTGLEMMPPLEYVVADIPWVHSVHPGLGILAPSDGWFVPGVDEVIPGFQSSQVTAEIVLIEVTGASEHTINSPRPPADPDAFATIGGLEPDGTFVWFGNGSMPPLPADFFGPGSDPFEGQVALDGIPIDPPIWGDASTLAKRDWQPVAPLDPPGAVEEVPIQIIALSLHSIEPIEVTYDGGLFPEPWDVQVSLSATVPPPGILFASKTHENGGVFDSDFLVQPAFTFTRVSDGQQMYLDTGPAGIPPLTFTMIGAPWVHYPNPGLEVIVPEGSWFVPGIEEVVPPDPLSQELRRMYANEPTGAARHTIFPARPDLTNVARTPEPLLQVRNYPNPFNPSTRIEFTLQRGGKVEVGIYDLGGRLVDRLAGGIHGPGAHSVLWTGTDLSGGPVASGVYFYKVKGCGQTVTGKVSLIK